MIPSRTFNAFVLSALALAGALAACGSSAGAPPPSAAMRLACRPSNPAAPMAQICVVTGAHFRAHETIALSFAYSYRSLAHGASHAWHFQQFSRRLTSDAEGRFTWSGVRVPLRSRTQFQQHVSGHGATNDSASLNGYGETA